MTTGCVTIATPASQHRGLGAESPESTMFCEFELCAEAVSLSRLNEGWVSPVEELGLGGLHREATTEAE